MPKVTKKNNVRAAAARKAWVTMRSARYRARKSEGRSKEALRTWCEQNRWRVFFFEGRTGAPRTGVIDAVMFRLKREDADALEIRLVQLKSGSGGLTAREISRLEMAKDSVSVAWLLAACDGDNLWLLPKEPAPGSRAVRSTT